MKEGRTGAEALFRFQPALADALYQVEGRRRLILERQKHLVSRKPTYDAKWFITQLRSLDRYSGALTAVVGIGTAIGDAFVWFFYHQSQPMLRHHLTRSRSQQIPIGIGGRGELEFVRQIRPPEHFVLYHGISSFLTIGDVSFVDRRTLKVVAIGELKSQETGPGQLKITLHMLAVSGTESIPFVSKGEASGAAEHTFSSENDLPPNGKRRLARQLKAMADALKNTPAGYHSDIHDAYHFDDLKLITNRIVHKSHAYSQVGLGLLIIAVRPSYARTFSRRVMSAVAGEEVVRRLDMLPNSVVALFDPNTKPDNHLIIGRIKTMADADTVPPFWWPIDVELSKRIYFRDIEVLTAYNPAHLVVRLRRLGFEVEIIERQPGPDYRVAFSPARGGRIEISGLGYFLHMIQTQLLKEEKVVELLLSLVKSVEEGALPSNSRTEISMVHHVV